jgi:hypothetical protein
VEHAPTGSVGFATTEVLRNVCSEAVKSNKTKEAGINSGPQINYSFWQISRRVLVNI